MLATRTILPPPPKANHLPRHRLRSHKHPRHIHLQQPVRIVRRVLQRRRLLLHARRGDEPVQPPVRGRNRLDDLVEQACVADVNATVV